MPCSSEARGEEIITIVNEIAVLRDQLAAAGVADVDDDDRMEAMDIIRRIERKRAMAEAAV